MSIYSGRRLPPFAAYVQSKDEPNAMYLLVKLWDGKHLFMGMN